mmetsp:Transcript_38767/g.97666  ORF Transcript_38767/g.97666 Transcript_38767/m.97666 type:complete len:373 (+) Transcript_38767:47-1165(+)
MAAPKVLHIHVVEGRDLIPMDHGKSSDPYVVVLVGSQKRKTKTIWKSLNPVWSETFKFELNDETPTIVEFRIWDKDRMSSDDRMGMVTVNLSEVEANNKTMDRWIAVERQKEKDVVSGELHVRIGIDREPEESPAASATDPASVDSSSSSSSSSSSASSDSSSGGGDTSAVSPPVASASDDDSSEVARLRRENEELRQKYTSLQSQYAALEQRYTSLQKNLINAKLSPRVRSESFEAEKEKGVARFTDEQREIAKAAFEEYDRDGNGSIDQSELILLMEELRRSKVLNMSDSLFKRYVRMNWKAIDTDESGEISFDEFMEFLFSSSMLNRDLATKVRQSSSDLIKRRSQTGMSPLKMERSTEPKETAADASQ